MVDAVKMCWLNQEVKTYEFFQAVKLSNISMERITKVGSINKYILRPQFRATRRLPFPVVF